MDTKEKFFSTQFADSLKGKKVLLVVAHHDDEVLFAGGLLSQLKCKLSILCLHKSFLDRKSPEKYVVGFKAVCKSLGAKAFFGTYEPQKAKIVSGKFAEYAFKCANMVRFLAKHKGYDTVITHNGIGEYGHVDHIIVHYACRIAFRKESVYCFGTNLNNAEIVVHYNVEDKKKLIDFYKDVWAANGYPFCYEPETYLRMK